MKTAFWYSISRCAALWCVLALPHVLSAQDSSSAFPVRVNGSVSLSTDVYESSGNTGWQARQGGQVSRAIARINVNLFEQIDLPFEFYATTEGNGYRQPFNQFGASPRLFGWLTLHGGYFSTAFSDLTFGDTRLLGGGIELSPGNFRLSVVHGSAQEARQADSTSFFGNQYARTLTAAKVGISTPQGLSLLFNALHAIDDTTSLAAPADTLSSALPAARENTALSLSVGVPIASIVRVQGEVAIAATSDDLRAPTTDDAGDVPSFLFTPRTSSHVDGAAKLSLILTPPGTWSLRLDGRWIGPGFTTLGYQQLQNDVLEGTVSPSVRLLDNTVYVRASLGVRRNNLRSTKRAATDRIIGSVFTGIQFSQAVGLDVQYSNYRLQSQHTNDTLRLANNFQTISIGPRFLFDALGGQNTLAANYALQTVRDNNPTTARTAENTTHSATLAHSLVLPSLWSFATSVLYNAVSATALSTNIVSISETASKQLFDNALTLSGSLSYSLVGTETSVSGTATSSTDNQLVARLTATYSFPNWGSFSLNLSTNNYTAAQQAARPSYTEYRAGLGYTLSL